MTIVESPRPTLEPYPVQPLSDLLARSARIWPDAVAIIDGDTGAEYTYGRLWQAVRGMARGLQDRGVSKGDRVAIVAPNSPEWVVAFYGANLAGATVTTLNPLYREREVAAQFSDSNPVLAFVGPTTEDVVRSVWERDTGIELLPDAWSLADSAAGEPDPVEIDPLVDLAVLPYSSGTTGVPKGVMLTHHNLVSNVFQTLTTGLMDRYSVMISFLPYFHIYGLEVLVNCALTSGAKQVVMPSFDVIKFLEHLERYRPTHLFVVPPVLIALANAEGLELDLSFVRFIMSGAAPLPVDVARRVSETYDVQVIQGYGMTEASPVTNITMLGRDKPGTVGPPLADTRQRVVDMESGKDLGFGEVGELLVQGPQVMKGYFGREGATAETLVDGPGGIWLRTGDVVSMDEEGYVTIADRAKEMIKYHGYQIAPAELEAVLMEHPDVADAAVVPKADAETGDEIPKAFVVPRGEVDLTAEAVMEHVADSVAPYKKVREVEFVAEIPKNPSGKILRRELRDRA